MDHLGCRINKPLGNDTFIINMLINNNTINKYIYPKYNYTFCYIYIYIYISLPVCISIGKHSRYITLLIICCCICMYICVYMCNVICEFKIPYIWFTYLQKRKVFFFWVMLLLSLLWRTNLLLLSTQLSYIKFSLGYYRRKKLSNGGETYYFSQHYNKPRNLGF